jgi:hypothetical protein
MRNLLTFVILCLTSSPQTYAQKSRRPASHPGIASVSYCDLIRHPQRFNHKVVRVKGSLFGGMEVSALEDFGCDNDRSVWVEFVHSYKDCTPNEVYASFRNTFHPPSDSEAFGPHRAEIVAIGKFEVAKRFKTQKGFGHLGGYPYRLTVKCLEQVQ